MKISNCVHPRWWCCCIVALSISLGVVGILPGQETATADDATSVEDEDASESTAEDNDSEADAPSVELDGVFQAVEFQVVRLEMEEWSSLKVREAIDHGAKVVAGDVLIQLETDELERAIAAAKHELEVDALSLRDAEIKLELARRNLDMSLRAAESSDRRATEDLKDYLTDGRDRRLRGFDRSVQSARNRLDYQAEELKQLEQMYAADDLTEETEEIILKRTRDAVESAQYSLDNVLNSQRRGIDFDVPRTEEQLEQAVAAASLALEEARRLAPQSLERQELQYNKQQLDLRQKEERLERLQRDLKKMTVVAPRSGVVYYGSQNRGKWTNPSSIEATLRPGASPKVRTDLLTIVQLRPLSVRASVPEQHLDRVRSGTEASVSPIAFPDANWSARVVDRSLIPVAEGLFDATLELVDADLPPAIVPGMKAKVKISASETSDD